VEDWTIEAMKFLLCGALQRTIWDESHYRRAAWLEKSENPSRAHHNLSTYGIGKDKNLDYGAGAIALASGLVEQTTDGYPVLKLNVLSWEVMRR